VTMQRALFWSSDSSDPNRSHFCGSNSWRRRAMLFAAMDDAPLTAQGGQCCGSVRRLVILDRDGISTRFGDPPDSDAVALVGVTVVDFPLRVADPVTDLQSSVPNSFPVAIERLPYPTTDH
ncbi:hypothetical protein U1Q18_024379, partial [Sarracenia purpurea var. burkii]